MMPQLQRLILHPLAGKIFLCVLASVYLVYLVAFVRFLSTSLSAPPQTIIEHPVNTNPDVAVKHWTAASMRDATDVDNQIGPAFDLTQGSNDTSQGKAAQQQGQPPRNGNLSYPLSTVGKVFFSNRAGQDLVCSGTAVVSSNQSVVDTAGHCLYWNGDWVQNLIFCPLYENGRTPFGCWAARDLEVPSDWLGAKPNDYHHDFGMAIVSPNSQGAFGKSWQHGGGTVVSIPCGMTGGSSGGPWFIKMSGNWYLNGHNDFTSIIQLGHMFSPYYDDTWYALYDKAQHT